MVDRPIIFSAPMVRALIVGRKTQTRRLVKPPRKWASKYPLLRTDVLDGGLWWWDGVHDRVGASAPMPYAPGDRLWVRENCWADWQGRDGCGVRYAADGAWVEATDEERWTALDCYAHTRHPDNATNTGQLVPSIHMPRWVSRLTLTVTDVRVQRVQEISEDDARDEGCWSTDAILNTALAESVTELAVHPSMVFRRLWNSLHGPGAWEANPHVVAITFTVEHRNIDAMELTGSLAPKDQTS